MKRIAHHLEQSGVDLGLQAKTGVEGENYRGQFNPRGGGVGPQRE